MAQTPDSLETSRYVVLVLAIVCYLAAVVVYFSTSAQYPITLSVLSAVGTVLLGLFMFAPIGACDAVAKFFVGLGNWLWWL